MYDAKKSINEKVQCWCASMKSRWVYKSMFEMKKEWMIEVMNESCKMRS